EALAKLDELLALAPHDSDALFRKALVLHKKAHQKTGPAREADLRAAAKAYEEAAAVAPHGDARAFNNLGLIREDLGDLAGAREAFGSGLDRDPSDPNVLTNLGRLDRDT